jgi:hypothetical protein
MSHAIEDRDGTPLAMGDKVTITGVISDITLPDCGLIVTTEEGFACIVPARAAVRQDDG